ncbi:MAG: dephospho-CoA kinase [Oscillospiraceae bacterium]|nr:dephospho-CoA kinase [Oscillospiraceae bacterium]MDY2678950.1 dephospho-CoA kinase [Oscillospiraceae bacterium]
MKKLIGLTGKTGAGKSTVSKMLEGFGAFIIDGDKVAREVLNLSPDLELKLKAAFGSDIYENGVLLRKELAKRAFSSHENTELLNSIFHPVINKRLFELSNEAFKTHSVAVVDAAAVIESGFYKSCDCLITVYAPESIRLERIMRRDSLTKEEAMRRINAQKDDEFYFSKSDIIINNFPPHDLSSQLENVKKVIFD